MGNELIIDAGKTLSRIAFLQDERLEQLHYEDYSDGLGVGDIYLARVVSVKESLNGAFLDIGYRQNAFLHYSDLGPNINVLKKIVQHICNRKQLLNVWDLDLNLSGEGGNSISERLKPNELVMVQILKEPIYNKGPRLTCNISIVGNLLILIPLSNQINISKKITQNSERKRLDDIMAVLKPKNMGVIVRTLSKNKNSADIEKDLRYIRQKWDKALKNLKHIQKPGKLMGEDARLNSLIRDLLGQGLDRITVSSKEIYQQLQDEFQDVMPNYKKVSRLYKGRIPVFEFYGIEKKIKALFGKRVLLPSGGSIVIEHTEAMHVIDVNSGHTPQASNDQETTAVLVNQEAVQEITRQLKLRDMGGIICVDFIDMRSRGNREKIEVLMNQALKNDHAITTVLRISRFGIMQLTRQRTRPQLNIKTKEQCPTCNGTGSITASIIVSDQIEYNLDYLLTKQNEKYLLLKVHPYLQAYFTKGIFSIQNKWVFKYKKWIPVLKDSSLALNEFRFYDRSHNIIKAKSHTERSKPNPKKTYDRYSNHKSSYNYKRKHAPSTS